jgi:DNA-binding GntR family transcriptional regulator
MGRAATVPGANIVARIAEQLEEDIVLGRLHPRERLIEQDLADRFGTHRAAVRQAIFALDAKGVIEHVPNRGAVVRDLKPEDARQIYEVREVLELAAVRAIPLPVAKADLAALRDIQKRHSRAVDDGDLRAVVRSNLEFHQRMFALCGNPQLIEGIEHFARKAHAIRSYSNANPGYLLRVKQDHLDMLDALKRGDRERLLALCRSHLRPSQEAYIGAYLARNPGEA